MSPIELSWTAKKTLKLKCFILLLSRILLSNCGFVFFSWKIFRWPFMRIWIQVKTALGLFLPYGRDWEAKNGRYRQLCWHQLTFLGLGRKTITSWDWNQKTLKVELQGDIVNRARQICNYNHHLLSSLALYQLRLNNNSIFIWSIINLDYSNPDLVS